MATATPKLRMVAAELLKASEGAHFPDDGEAYSHRMVLYRVYGDEAGETHLREIELPELELNAEGVEKLRGLLNIPAISVGIVQLLKPTPSQDLHPAPERRLLVFLSGETEITTTTGDRQVLGAGDCLLADDVGSKGHYTCDIGPEPRTMVTVGIPRAWQVPDL